ncbi:hypothetical protein NEOLEDRAFT_1179405 [Neolentinus lepideus HHB14362 ss-1]|uniref:Uncharacterized protein n=1 Tax=Neolentinus lepideus HHB14362 ss-1 TaxID=1314782 RepID=A0A165RY87_9AGAM|nr:hypothetical protein NEOLEDRAFT_1179405 [Neolentinus lepideus HHB14362 ss-1]
MSRTPSSTSSRVHDNLDILSPSAMPSSLPRSEGSHFCRRNSFDLPLPHEDLTPYVDHMAVGLALNETYLAHLHEFGQLAGQLPDIIAAKVAIYQQGTEYQTQQLVLESRIETSVMTTVLEEVQELLASKLELTNKQKDEVRAITWKLLIEPDRTDFDITDEVMELLKTNRKKHGFEAAFASPARAQALKSQLRREASYVQNQYRGYIRDYVFGSKDGKTKACGLTIATNRIIKKFVPVNETHKPMASHMIQMAILRQFARDHPGTLNIEETSDEQGEAWYTKAKRGRVVEGEDFWSQVTGFLEEKDSTWGKDLKLEGWSGFITECLETERSLFPDDNLAAVPMMLLRGHQQSPLTMDGARPLAAGVLATAQSSALIREALLPSVLPRGPSPSQAVPGPSHGHSGAVIGPGDYMHYLSFTPMSCREGQGYHLPGVTEGFTPSYDDGDGDLHIAGVASHAAHGHDNGRAGTGRVEGGIRAHVDVNRDLL